MMIPSLTGTKLGSLHGDVGQDGVFMFSYTLYFNVMMELMIPSLTVIVMHMRAYLGK